MGVFSDKMFATSQRLLTKYGESVSVARSVTSAFVPATGVVATTSTTTYTGVGYPSNYNITQIDGTIIRQDDILLVFNSATAPLVDDVFTVNGTAYTGIAIQDISAQGESVIYKIQLRK